MEIHCITWKDERWSASEKDLKEINAILKASGKLKRVSLYQKFVNMISYLKHAMKWTTRSGFGS